MTTPRRARFTWERSLECRDSRDGDVPIGIILWGSVPIHKRKESKVPAMKTEVKKIDDVKRQINVEVSGARVADKFEEVFKEIAKEAKVQGFRPGHAPRDILEKRYAAAAHEQVIKDLVPAVYQEAVGKEGMDVVELPEISEVKLDRTKLSFTATVSVVPEIQLKEYKGIKIGYKKIVVTDDDVKRQIDSIKEQRKAPALDDRFARTLGYPDMAVLQEALRQQLWLQKENQERRRIEEEIVAAVMKDLKFTVPDSLVQRQLHDLLRQTKVDLAMRGVARETIEAKEKDIEKDLQPQALQQVKVYLVLSQIAKKENIAADDHMSRHVMEFLLSEAQWREEA